MADVNKSIVKNKYQVASIKRRILDAAKLRLDMHAFERDRKRRVTYCTDTNVVMLFLQPTRHGPKTESGGGYGLVFEDDPQQQAEVLGAALGRYIFSTLTSRFPLLLLPGHDVEVRHQYDRLSKDVAEQESSERAKSLRELLVPYVSGEKTLDNRALDQLSALIASETDEIEQLARMQRLIRQGKISRLSNHVTEIAQFWADRGSQEVLVARRALEAPRDMLELIEEGTYRQEWQRRLSQESSARSPKRLNGDTSALARLELINRRLRPIDRSVALITGDEAMFRAARTFKPFTDSSLDFAALFLRHPRAFLASNKIIARPDDPVDLAPNASLPNPRRGTGSDFVVTWIDALLSRYMDLEGPMDQKLSALLQNGSESQSRLENAIERDYNSEQHYRQFRSKWTIFCKSLIDQHTTSSSLTRAELRENISHNNFKNIEASIKEIDNIKLRNVQPLWQDFIDSSIITGVGIDLDRQRQDEISRNVPPLFHEEFHSATKFVQIVLKKKPSESDDIRKILEQALPSIKQEDPFGYAAMLAYATLFAFLGNWYVARVLAERAIKIAEGIETGAIGPGDETGDGKTSSLKQRLRSLITGREAYYFAAVASRNTSTKKQDLVRAAQYLSIADQKRALELDQEHKNIRHGSASVSTFDSIFVVRIETEKLAIRVVALSFDRFGANPPHLTDTLSRSSYFEECRNIISKTRAIIEVSTRGCVEGKLAWMARFIERQLCQNALIADAFLEEDVKGIADCQDLYDLLDRNLNESTDEVGLQPTMLVKTVQLYAEAKYGDMNLPARASLKRRIENFTHKLKISDDFLTMNYDRLRMNYILERAAVNLRDRFLGVS